MKMFHSKKRNNVGLYLRRKGALERLLIQQENFVKEKKDKVNSKGIIIPYAQECKRLEKEAIILKHYVDLGTSTALKKKRK